MISITLNLICAIETYTTFTWTHNELKMLNTFTVITQQEDTVRTHLGTI